MSHGKDSNGYITIQENTEIYLRCHRNGLVCPRCKSKDATFEIPIVGIVTIDECGRAEIEVDLEVGDKTTVSCQACGEDSPYEAIAGNDYMRQCRDCGMMRDKLTFVRTVTGRSCCPTCAAEHDMEFFDGEALID